MFHTGGFIFIAVLCVVNAAFTVNIPENNVRDVEKCVSKICDRQCRQMGFIVRNCVGFTCECDKFTKSNDIEDDLNADDENAISEELSDCNPAACDQLCRRLKFPGGACVNGRCKCDNFRQVLDIFVNNDFKAVDKNDMGEELSDCNPLACDQLCRRLKFHGGVCVNGRCKCDNFRQDLELFVNNYLKAADENDVGEELSGCNPSACDQLCRRLKFPGGVCVNGRCKCDNFRQDLELFVNNDVIVADENDIAEKLSDCNPSACDQLCRRLKFHGGVCVNGRCKCDNSRQDLVLFSNNYFDAADNDDKKELSDCNPSACDQLCRRLKFPGGACVNGRCKCDNFRRDLGNREKILKAPVCDEKKCNISCRKMHYLGGFCQLYECVCY